MELTYVLFVLLRGLVAIAILMLFAQISSQIGLVIFAEEQLPRPQTGRMKAWFATRLHGRRGSAPAITKPGLIDGASTPKANPTADAPRSI